MRCCGKGFASGYLACAEFWEKILLKKMWIVSPGTPPGTVGCVGRNTVSITDVERFVAKVQLGAV